MNLPSIPAANAQIEWSDDEQHRVTELVVFNRVSSSGPKEDRGGRRFQASSGACTSDWLKGDARATPEGIFVDLLKVGFVDEDAQLEALDELGKIAEAAWARAMAEAMRQTLRARCYDDEETERIKTPVYGDDPDGDGVQKPYYVGSQWKVDAEGIDTLDDAYFIEAERLGELYHGDDPASSWLPHLAEKTWVDLKDFEQAFRCALKVHHGRYVPLPENALERGLYLARREGGLRWD